jgi:septal ring factor EnvC (AmiA/AmiB activator)
MNGERRTQSAERRIEKGFLSTFCILRSAFCILLLVPAAHSQTSRDADLARVQSEIARLKNRMQNLRSQAQSAERDLEEADVELGIRSRELDLAVDMQAQLVAQQQVLEGQIAALGPRIARQKAFLARRLAGLYRLGGLSYIRLLLSIDRRQDPLQAMSMLGYLVSRDSRAVTRFEQERVQLAARRADLADRERRLAAMRSVVEQRQHAVAAARAQKERLLASLQREGTQSEQRLAELEEKARRLEHLLDLLARQSQGAITAATDIRTLQGALAWPVQGKVVEPFGRQRNAKFSTVTFNNGLKIAAPPGAEVHAVFPGTVLYSQWFKGYGNLIILDHGNRVFSLYGNLKSPTVTPGGRIQAGQVIAGVGESEDAQSGYLYFEIRQDNKPEDPQKWLR